MKRPPVMLEHVLIEEMAFPPVLPAIRRIETIAKGDQVTVKGRSWFGVGVVERLEPDGRLAWVRFYSTEGWWHRADLERISAP